MYQPGWTWASIIPGRSVAVPSSYVGFLVDAAAAGPVATVSIRPWRTVTRTFAVALPRPSMRRAAWMVMGAVSVGASDEFWATRDVAEATSAAAATIQ